MKLRDRVSAVRSEKRQKFRTCCRVKDSRRSTRSFRVKVIQLLPRSELSSPLELSSEFNLFTLFAGFHLILSFRFIFRLSHSEFPGFQTVISFSIVISLRLDNYLIFNGHLIAY